MKFLIDRPGVVLLLSGIIAFLARQFFGWVPLIGGVMSTILFVFAIFAIVGGVWLLLMDRKD